MDGSRRKALVTVGLIAPSSIVVDVINKDVFWTDSRLDYIQRVDYYGKFRYLLSRINKYFTCICL